MAENTKFGRNFRLTVEPNDGGAPIIITLPFTVTFQIQRNTLSNLNVASINIYNLSEAHRSQIYQDWWAITSNRQVTLEIGYGQIYRVFTGRIYQASSAREGTNIITCIEAQDGQFDMASTMINQSLPAGTTQKELLLTLAGQFPTIKPANIGNFPQVFNRGIALNGNVWDLILRYTGGNAYIDNNKLYCLNPNEVPDEAPLTINDATGLLQTPRRDGSNLLITTLMEPQIQVGNLVNLQSSVNKIFNGQYKVNGLRHHGMISGALCGHAYSTFSFLAPGPFGTLNTVPNL